MWGTRNLFNAYNRDMFGSIEDDNDVITLYSEAKEREEERRYIVYRKYFSS